MPIRRAATPHDSKAICAIGYREPDQTNINVVYLPKKSGMVAMADEVYSKSAVYTKDEVYSKSESDARFSRQKNVGLLEPVGWWRDSDTGYTRQWGYLGREGDSVGTTVVTFPTQFFRECTSVTVAHIRVSGQVMLSVGGVTKSGFTVIPSEKCNGVFWSAEGY
ncbi:hypothetical protein J8V57_14890 [Xenorhabdus sp. PB61.4]|uniref:gp53-like domain-containing protein n=1 Tax=Xenorhabdus sp. PB61.4 TaxID=2788940 RepID=UPI001E644121|nr:hypothetical protein [Xenorhabdus sp. PB61.4]MCC8367540.1 hypothetical protein [Xenorhabdus sp. PB61.4]